MGIVPKLGQSNGVSSPVVQQCKNRPTDDDHAVINQAPTILRVVTNHGGYAVANYLISSAVSFKFFSSRSASIGRCPLAFSVRIVSSRRLISACNSRKTLVRGLPISSIHPKMPNAGGLVCAIELEPSVRYPTLNIDSGRGCEARTKKRPGMAVPGRVSLGALSVCTNTAIGLAFRRPKKARL